MSKADFSAQKGKEMVSTGLLSTHCDLMFYSPATSVKFRLFRDDQNALPHPTAVIQKSAPPYSTYRNKELLLLAHSTPAHLILALLILVSF